MRKTTLHIDKNIYNQIKSLATKEGKTISNIVDGALRLILSPARSGKKLKPLPSFNGGSVLVDIANRDALYSTMEKE